MGTFARGMLRRSGLNRAVSTMRRLIVSIIVLTCSHAPAEVKLAGVFGDNMVVQRDKPVPVWGSATPGEQVTVEFAGDSQTARTNAEGTWLTRLGPFPAGGPHTMTIAANETETIAIRNILVGEVWIASGQSNMAWSVRETENGDAEIAAAKYPRIRLATVRGTAVEPQSDIPPLPWTDCNPTTVPWFSAVAYFFGRDLYAALDVPIGLIDTSEGSSPLRSWISREVQYSNLCFTNVIEEYKTFPQRLKAHRQAIAKAKAEGQPVPSHVGFYEAFTDAPGILYNARIHPLAPFAMRGFLWYQGENEALFRRGRVYQDQFPLLIADWRKRWGQEDCPFLYVQLAGCGPARPTPAESEWAEVRDGQRRGLEVSKTGMVVTTDICEPELHPCRKIEVGKRLALLARAIAYGEDVVCSGPLVETVEFRDGKAYISFTHTGAGLETRGDTLEGFAIAGMDREFFRAEAAIDQGRVVVYSQEVPEPQVVRYAWADNPRGNLFNADGFPASCFQAGE